MTRASGRPVAIAQTLGINLLAAFGVVLTRLALRDVSPLDFAWTATMLAAVALGSYTFFWRRERLPRRLPPAVWRHIVLMGLAGVAVGGVCLTGALRYLTPATLTYLLGYVSLLTMGLSIIVLKERPTSLQWVGFGIALAGLRLYFWERPPQADLIGLGIAAVGIVAVAIENNLARQIAIEAGDSISSLVVSSVALLVGALLLVPVAVLAHWPPELGGLSNWAIVLFRGLVGIALVKTVWNLVMRTLRSYEVSVLATSNVIWAALISIPILGELPRPYEVVGIGLMIVGLIIVNWRPAVAHRAVAGASLAEGRVCGQPQQSGGKRT